MYHPASQLRVFSLCKEATRLRDALFYREGMRLRGSIAKGGSRFAFLGRGREYVLKTMSRAERRLLDGMYLNYEREIMRRPNSLLPRFMLFCKAELKGETIGVVAMASVFDGCSFSPCPVLGL